MRSDSMGTCFCNPCYKNSNNLGNKNSNNNKKTPVAEMVARVESEGAVFAGVEVPIKSLPILQEDLSATSEDFHIV
jgi:hypothetical protein